MEAPLSQREFDLWRESDREFKQRMEEHMAAQATVNLDIKLRVNSLEVNQENAGKLSAKLSSVVAAGVAAVITGVFHLLGGK